MAFIGIKVSADISRLFRGLDLPGEKVSENEQHITILCFEENWAISSVADAMEAAYKVLKDVDPFKVKTDTITCFPKFDKDTCPVIAKIDSEELSEVNKKLKKAFDKAKIGYANNFKVYNPHITLGWAKEEIKDIKISPVEFTVTEITLWAGDNGDDRIFITFPLRGIETKKHSYLVQKADVFHKLSSKSPDTILTKTVERRLLPRSDNE